MEKEKTLIIQALKSQRHELSSIWYKCVSTNQKDSNASVEVRNKGNNLYLQKNHDAQVHREIFTLYCKSIALAPSESEELAVAYANRSAFLFHISKYKDCVQDIDKVLGITKSNALKVKLLLRKTKSLINLGFCKCNKLLEVVPSLGSDVEGYKDKEIDDLINELKKYSLKNAKSEQEDGSKERIGRIISKINNIQDYVTIHNNQKYGRHLVASKDYVPGDIILVEEFATSFINPKMAYIICHHCYKTSWSSVPCNNCSWVMFCSENCKENACVAYHDIECTMIPFLNSYNYVLNSFGLSIRIICMAIKEFGSLDKLRIGLQSMDEYNDEDIKNCFMNSNDGKFSLRSLYFLKSDGISNFILKTVSKALIVPLIALVKHAQLIKDFKYEKLESFSCNEDVIFLGSLLIKVSMIKIVNSYEFTDEKLMVCNDLKSIANCRQQSCCCKGNCLVPLTSLINHSCFPNAGKCFTTNQKIIVYALQPIKKGSQVFISYVCNFYDAPVSFRHELLKQYNFKCACRACKESWPPLCANESAGFQSYLEMTLAQDCQTIFQALDSEKTYFKKEEIDLLSEKIIQVLGSVKQPSYLTCIADQAMNDIFSRMYSIPQITFGECLKSQQ